MNKAIVVGGSNGIGLAIAKNLINQGYHVFILDRYEPEEVSIPINGFTYYHCDLLDLDEDQISPLVKDSQINLLMITAGFGRIADFEYYHISEIKNIFYRRTGYMTGLGLQPCLRSIGILR